MVFRLPPRNAIQYATGYVSRIAATEAAPEYSSERRNCSRYSWKADVKLPRFHVNS